MRQNLRPKTIRLDHVAPPQEESAGRQTIDVRGVPRRRETQVREVDVHATAEIDFGAAGCVDLTSEQERFAQRLEFLESLFQKCRLDINIVVDQQQYKNGRE